MRLQLLVAGSLLLASPPAPVRLPLERVEVELILVDVEVRDADGQPMRGLKAEDFDIRLDGMRRPTYSADDHCGCESSISMARPVQPSRDEAPPTPPPPGSETSSGTTGVPAGETVAAIPPGSSSSLEPAVYVLYFDFALLDLDGRASSFNEARRWLKETMRDGDRVMLAGHRASAGVAVIADFTSDREGLIAAIDRAKDDRGMLDPQMSFLEARKRACKQDTTPAPPPDYRKPICWANAMDDYDHGRRTYGSMSHFMARLASEPGRKHMILMHQMVVLFPGALYPNSAFEDTQIAAIEQAGAEATASRVVIHAIQTGIETLGSLADLAESTGGTWNGKQNLRKVMDAVRDRCECLYRIGIEPPDGEKGRVHNLTVRVRQRQVADLRVRTFSAADRWMRRARSVLTRPTAARDLPVTAAIVPVSASKSGWTVKIQVALHAAALTEIPSGRSGQAEWEAGALLAADGRKNTWEMLAVSTMNAGVGTAGPEWFVHEKMLTGLPPGRYRLGAFVRDRVIDLFGGAAAVLDLPDPLATDAVGPVVLLSGRRILTTDLPLQPAGQALASRGIHTVMNTAPSGENAGDEISGPPYEIASWLCGDGARVAVQGASDSTARPERYLSFENSVIMTFPEDLALQQAGDCVKITDRLEAGLLDDSPYRYHLRWRPRPQMVPIEREVALP